MQLRFATDLSAEEYVRRQAWKDARLDTCPLHPNGGCRFAGHGTYNRKSPAGTKIARWYCADGHQTFGLIPDCLSSRLSGSLADVEAVVDLVEKSPSQNAAAEHIRLDIDLPGALRWIRRRLFLVQASLILLIELFPLLFPDCRPDIRCFRNALSLDQVLPALREIFCSHLHLLGPPVGFGDFPRKMRFQQSTGTDPPPKVL